MAPTLYHIPKTCSSPLVQCLVELDLVKKHVVKVVETTFSGIKKPEYLAINPMGTAPAFQDGEIIIWESGAVLTYLLERYDTEHKFHPACLTAESTEEQIAYRAKFLHLQHYSIVTVYPFMAALYIHTFKPLEEQDAAYVASAKEKWQTCFGPVLEKWLGEGRYFLGDEVSAVDFVLAKPLNNVNSLGLLKDFPALNALFERLRSRPSFASAYEGLPSDDADANAGEHQRIMILVPGN
jgi:glutathione S-transferase